MPPFDSLSFPALWLATFVVVSIVSLASTAAGTLMERLLSDRTRIFAVDLSPGQLRHERLSYLRFVLLLATGASVVLWTDAIRFGAEGPLAIAGTFAAIWTGFEIYYYGLHRALHTSPLYRFHAHHHESRVTTAWTGQSLSVVESLGWIGGLLLIPTLLGLVWPLSWTGFLVYFVANTFVNVAGHANVELNPISARALTWLTHPWTYHSLHHARFKKNYSFASTFMDRLFGTEWEDWQELHRRVFAGRPLERLTERGVAAD